jgi:hypothetical protein
MAMWRKILFLGCAAILVLLGMSSDAKAWYTYHYGYSPYGYHYGYHYGGYGGGYRYGYYRRW